VQCRDGVVKKRISIGNRSGMSKPMAVAAAITRELKILSVGQEHCFRHQSELKTQKKGRTNVCYDVSIGIGTL
jgi:hypothetical protein